MAERRDYQAILDAAFEKLGDAGVELDHGKRWDVETLTPIEKVQVILNDIYSEVTRGGFDYWLQRRYAARGGYELQRVVAAIVESHRERVPDHDAVAAEVLLGLMEAIELAPASYDPEFPKDPTKAESKAYQALCDRRRFLDAVYYLDDSRMLEFNEAVVDHWPESLDPFSLPAGAPVSRRGIEPLRPDSKGPVRYPSVAVGFTEAGRSMPVHATDIDAYGLYNRVALGMWLGGAAVDDVARFVGECERRRDDSPEIVRRCAATVDADGTLARTGEPADVDALVAELTWTPGYMFGQIADAVRERAEGGVVMTAPDLDALEGGPEAAALAIRSLDPSAEESLADQAGSPDRAHPTILRIDAPADRALDVAELLELGAIHGIVLVIGLDEEARHEVGFRASAHAVQHVNLHDDEWGY